MSRRIQNPAYVLLVAFLAITVFSGLLFNPLISETDDGEYITVVDALDRIITIKLPINRIVIGGKGDGLLVSVAYMFPKAASSLYGLTTSVGSTNYLSSVDPDIGSKMTLVDRFSVEEIAKMNPSVVILKSYMKADLGDSLENIGVSVVYIELENLESYLRDIQILGKIFGDSDRADKIAAYYHDTYMELYNNTSSLDMRERPKVLLIYYSLRGGSVSFLAPGYTWLQTSMIDVAGGYPLSSELAGSGWNTVSFEQIATWDPNIIFIVTYSSETTPSEVKDIIMHDPLWRGISAVSHSRVYAFPDDCGNQGGMGSWESPGSRWILGLQYMAEKIGTTSIEIDIEDVTEAYFIDMYGLDPTQASDILGYISGDFT